MNPVKKADCGELLLDLLWYEILCRRLSPEMESILACHLSECPACSARFSEFAGTHEEAVRLGPLVPGCHFTDFKERP